MRPPEPSLYDRLRALSDSDLYPYHMPGHKRNGRGLPLAPLYEIDITEIDGFDDLHAPTSILRDAMRRAARFYGSEHTAYLVNGSSCGVLSALLACGDGGGRVLFARNAHRSAYHALYLGRMEPVYLWPETVEPYGFSGGIAPEAVERALEREPDLRAVFLTSPTYEGILSDVPAIVKAAHDRGVPVIVDEAHGAHLTLFEQYAGQSALAAGADLVIQSLHKTLPAPTQTALLHVNGRLADRERLSRYLRMFQSSSPSYVLMSGIDECIRLLERDGRAMAAAFTQRMERLRERLLGLRRLRLYGTESDRRQWERYHIAGQDAGKVLLSDGQGVFHGRTLYRMLRERYHLQPEMAAPSYVLAMLTVGDEDGGFDRLADALLDLDRDLSDAAFAASLPQSGPIPRASSFRLNRNMPLFEAQNTARKWVALSEAAGETAAEPVLFYPPGIPLAAPGEVLTEPLIAYLQACLDAGETAEGIQLRNQKAGLWVAAASQERRQKL